MFHTGSVIRLTNRFDKIKKEGLTYHTPTQSLALDYLYSKEKDNGYSESYRQEHPNGMIHYVYYQVTEIKRIRYRHRKKQSKAKFLKKHNEKTSFPEVNFLYYKEAMIERIECCPKAYSEYTSLLWGTIAWSPSLLNLYRIGTDINLFNWCGASGGDFTPNRILSDFFIIDHRCWWDHIPYRTFKYETETMKWWFSIFDEYELGSIDFYYPVNPKEGEEIEVLVSYDVYYGQCKRRTNVKIKWIHGANGLTVFCLLPHLYLYIIECATFYLQLPKQRVKKVRNYAYNQMLKATQEFRRKNMIINF